MSLFQPKIIKKALGGSIVEIPPAHLSLLTNWKDSIENGILESQNEVAVHAPFTQNIMVGILGYETVGHGDTWTIAREYGVAGGAVDLALGHFSAEKENDKVIAPFELKGAKTRDLDAIMPGRHKTPVQQAWDYARDIKGAQWVLVSNYVELRLYAVSETSLVYERFELAQLIEPEVYARFILLLHADNLLTGNTLALLHQSQQADKDITNQLYQDYKTLRELLLTHLIEDNPQRPSLELINPAQKLLDRLLFIAFAEDKGLIPENSIKQAFEHADPYHPRPVYENFKGLFKAIDQGNKHLGIPAYNGGLFAPDEALDALVVSDAVCESVNELAEYDFDSEISVTVLGHIFEQSIADLEALSSRMDEGELPTPPKTKAVSGRRKRQGVVYTPDHITAFIVEHTLGAHIKEQFHRLLSGYGQFKKDGSIQWKRGSKTELRFWYAWQERLQQIKVVDPACGSGAFLVAAFDWLHGEYQRVNDKLAELTGQHSVLDLNKTILNDNLYGVDINRESIEISKLSLWLKTAEKGKSLTSLDDNLKAGNSLGLDEPALQDSFTWQTAFPGILAQGGFDVVLGNPPYVRQERFSEIKPWLEAHYAVYHGVADLYAYFFELGMKLLKPGGRLGYISSSTFFKTGSGEPLRRFLLDNAVLENIVDFGDLQVFEGVTTYPAILTLNKGQDSTALSTSILVLDNILPDNLGQYFIQHHGRMNPAQLSHAGWQLEDERLHALRQKLTRGYPTLKDVYGSPLYGIKTGLNAAFVIDNATRQQLLDADPKSADLLKPFLEGKDLKKWHAEPRGLWLIFTRRGTDIEKYPAIKAYLSQFKERLMPKPKDWPKGEKWPGRKAGPYEWYEIQDTVAYYQEFEKPKIQYGHFSSGPLFHFNQQGHLSNDKSYIVPSNDAYLLGLLNSAPYWLLITALCPFVRGGYYELRAQYMETLPIPSAHQEQKQQITMLAQQCQTLAEQRYKVQQGVTRRIPDLCPPDREAKLTNKLKTWWELDFDAFQKEIKKTFKTTIPLAERNNWQDFLELSQQQITDLSRELADKEKILNQIVYAIFKLTASEIQLVEER